MTKLTANRNRKEFFLNVTVNARIYLNLFKSDRFVIFGNDDDDTVVTLDRGRNGQGGRNDWGGGLS